METSKKRGKLSSNSELVVDVSDPDVVSIEGNCIVDDDVTFPATSEEDAYDDASDFEETNDETFR